MLESRWCEGALVKSTTFSRLQKSESEVRQCEKNMTDAEESSENGEDEKCKSEREIRVRK